MMQRVADWHGEKAVEAYLEWVDKGEDSAMIRYLRHLRIANFIWNQ